MVSKRSLELQGRGRGAGGGPFGAQAGVDRGELRQPGPSRRGRTQARKEANGSTKGFIAHDPVDGVKDGSVGRIGQGCRKSPGLSGGTGDVIWGAGPQF